VAAETEGIVIGGDPFLVAGGAIQMTAVLIMTVGALAAGIVAGAGLPVPLVVKRVFVGAPCGHR